MRHITRNAIRCHSCGGIAESRNRHHMAHCTCGLVAADGGMEYLRRVAEFLWDPYGSRSLVVPPAPVEFAIILDKSSSAAV